MTKILSEKTNLTKVQKQKQEFKNDNEKVKYFIKDIFNTTKDFELKYNLSKCIEIIEGKENQEIVDLKNALEQAMIENEVLEEERMKLIVENEHLKEKLNK